jgi:mono/diheme cytochrome c family protein
MRAPFRHHLLVAAAALMLPPSCNSGYSPPQVPPQPASQSAEAHASLLRGRSIHQAKCATCHAFEDPAKYSEGELTDHILPRMSRLAKLTDNEQDAVRAYLLSVSKR